jgi:hypothetical protein
MGKCLADMPNSTLAVLLGSNLVLPGICTCQPRLQNAHSPHGKLMFCSLFVGRRSLRLFRHGLHKVFLDHRQHSSWKCECICAKLPIAPMGKRLADMPDLTLVVRLGSILVLPGMGTCQPCLQISHRPDGKIADVLAPTHACTTANASVNYSGYVPHRDLANFPSPWVGKWLTCLPRLSLALLRLTLRSPTECTCRRDLKFSHRPDGKVADVLAPTHACTTAAHALVNCSRYVPQRPELSHRPDGRVADVLAPTHACITANALVKYRGCVPQRP